LSHNLRSDLILIVGLSILETSGPAVDQTFNQLWKKINIFEKQKFYICRSIIISLDITLPICCISVFLRGQTQIVCTNLLLKYKSAKKGLKKCKEYKKPC